MTSFETYLFCIAIVFFLIAIALFIWWKLRNINRFISEQPFATAWKKPTWLKNALWLPITALSALGIHLFQAENERKNAIINTYTASITKIDTAEMWQAPDIAAIPNDYPNKKEILYGRNLIANTSDYFGPEGIITPISNGMNCQNCHLQAGAKPFGNNYSAVASTYPKFRARSGAQETIHKRINDCFQRSLNGEALDSNSYEMKSIVAYMNWLGSGIPKGKTPKGAGLVKLPFMERAASPEKGQLIYTAKCASCHNADGQGLAMPEGNGRRYPPLWGERSYAESAGLFRLSMLAGYVKANMPFGASYQNPQLTDEEAWDVAAFINAQPHPKHKFLAQDFPKIEKKPFDHPFGPFKDTLSEVQHKFGPWSSGFNPNKK
jgi:thiosulfate dehydrogenase